MSTLVQDYDIKAALQYAEIERPTPKQLTLLDRYFMIHEGNVRKAGLALKAYLRLIGEPDAH